MTESTLSITVSDLREEVMRFMSFGRTYSSLNATNQADVTAIINRGLRSFYYPPTVRSKDGRPSAPHEWTFLKPVTTIEIGPDISTTIATAGGQTGTTITVTDAVFYEAIVGESLVVNDVANVVVSVTSTTECVVTDSVTTVAAETVTLTLDAVYALPDDCGGLCGPLTYAAGVITGLAYDTIQIVRESTIRADRQASSSTTDGVSQRAAVRHKKYPTATGGAATEGQRLELMLFPEPDAIYTLTYRYNVLPDKLDATATPTNNVYPYGGMQHSETIIAAVLAMAEKYRNDGGTVMYAEFMDRLAASIAVDRRSTTPESLGYGGDDSDWKYGASAYSNRYRRMGNTTYNGTLY